MFLFLLLAALIRGNRNNCTQFSQNLDWLVSKLERLESSSGKTVTIYQLKRIHFKTHFYAYHVITVKECQDSRFDFYTFSVRRSYTYM